MCGFVVELETTGHPRPQVHRITTATATAALGLAEHLIKTMSMLAHLVDDYGSAKQLWESSAWEPENQKRFSSFRD